MATALADDQADRADGAAWAHDVLLEVQRLPALQAAILLMAYRSNLTQVQIAAHLGLPLAEVKVAVARAMVDLGRRLTGQPVRPA